MVLFPNCAAVKGCIIKNKKERNTWVCVCERDTKTRQSNIHIKRHGINTLPLCCFLLSPRTTRQRRVIIVQHNHTRMPYHHVLSRYYSTYTHFLAHSPQTNPTSQRLTWHERQVSSMLLHLRSGYGYFSELRSVKF
jgi:hypothetical protein